MPLRWADWWRQSEADLRHARHALEDADFEWACFAAQQAAEKGLKAVHGGRGQEAWGHSVTELLKQLEASGPSTTPEAASDTEASTTGRGADDRRPDPLLDQARALDKMYTATRYPNGLPSGAPADYYTRAEAERAIADAEAILARCRGMLPK